MSKRARSKWAKGERKIEAPFVPFPGEMVESAAFRALSGSSFKLLFLLGQPGLAMAASALTSTEKLPSATSGSSSSGRWTATRLRWPSASLSPSALSSAKRAAPETATSTSRTPIVSRFFPAKACRARARMSGVGSRPTSKPRREGMRPAGPPRTMLDVLGDHAIALARMSRMSRIKRQSQWGSVTALDASFPHRKARHGTAMSRLGQCVKPTPS